MPLANCRREFSTGGRCGPRFRLRAVCPCEATDHVAAALAWAAHRLEAIQGLAIDLDQKAAFAVRPNIVLSARGRRCRFAADSGVIGGIEFWRSLLPRHRNARALADAHDPTHGPVT
jgi:hypothetical protein